MKKCIIALLIFCMMFAFTSCNMSSLPEEPEDFSFSLTWGTYGISSYDSATGRLVKTDDATVPEDYVTTYAMSEDELNDVYQLIREVDIESYPDEYDPHEIMGMTTGSDPSMTIVLTIHTRTLDKTVTAEDIALSYDSKNPKGQKFLDTVKAIRDMLTATEEWKALPDYERYYD